jgi:hypothetical protein
MIAMFSLLLRSCPRNIAGAANTAEAATAEPAIKRRRETCSVIRVVPIVKVTPSFVIA